MIKTLYPEFRRWSERGSVWLVSDTHFDDSNREYMGYEITSEEHAALLKDFCHRGDTLIHLGDVGNPEYLKNVKAYKVLILGNHDKGPSYYEDCFNEIYDGPLFISKKILLSHEPMIGDCYFNIHGHNHSGSQGWPDESTHLNIAPNVFGYIPVNLKNIIENGVLKDIPSIHRLAIEKQKEFTSEKDYTERDSL